MVHLLPFQMCIFAYVGIIFFSYLLSVLKREVELVCWYILRDWEGEKFVKWIIFAEIKE